MGMQSPKTVLAAVCCSSFSVCVFPLPFCLMLTFHLFPLQAPFKWSDIINSILFEIITNVWSIAWILCMHNTWKPKDNLVFPVFWSSTCFYMVARRIKLFYGGPTCTSLFLHHKSSWSFHLPCGLDLSVLFCFGGVACCVPWHNGILPFICGSDKGWMSVFPKLDTPYCANDISILTDNLVAGISWDVYRPVT